MKKLCLFLLAGFLMIQPNAVDAQERVEKSFTGIETIQMNFGSGDCILKKGSSNTVKVTLEYTFDKDDFVPIFEQRGSLLELEEEFEGRNVDGWSKWTLEVPDGLVLKMNTGSGDISAGGLTFDLKSNSGSGDIAFESISGSTKINTGSGEVEASNYDGKFQVNTGSGDIRLMSSKGAFSINAGSGDVKVLDSSAELSINTGSGDISTTNVAITGISSFNSGSGDSEIVLSKALDYDLSANSGSGNAVIDFNGQEISGFVTMKANKKNGEIIAPFEFDKVEEENNGSQTTVKKTVKLGSKNIEINVGTGSGKAIIKK